MSATPVYIQQPVFDETLHHGSATVTTAGTAVPLSSSSAPCIEVLIQVKESNTGKIYIGGVGVPNTGASGVVLSPPVVGVTPPSLPISARNLNQVYIDSTVNGEGVNFIYW